MRSTIISMFVGLALFSAASCTSGTKQAVEDTTDAAANILLPVAQENELGKEMSAELAKELTFHPDDEVQAYVRGLGNKVVAAADDVPPGIKFTFRVVQDDETVNAFAIPGGHIYVYTGLMRLAEDEAELVSVLGHEVAHVTKRHIAQRLIGMYGYQTVAKMVLGEEPGIIGDLVSGVVTGGLMMKHGRDHERHADVNGLRYTIASGWDPHGFATLFRRMESVTDIDALEIFMSHPLPKNRVEHVEVLLQNRADLPEKRNKEAYQAMLQKLGAPTKTPKKAAQPSGNTGAEPGTSSSSSGSAEPDKPRKRRQRPE